MNLSNRTVVVTGGTSGIGLAFALKLLELGNQVIVIGRSQATLNQITTKHKGLIGLQGDVSDVRAVREMAAFLRERYPEVSILFNSAGIMRAFNWMDDNLDMEQATEEVATNLNGTIWMTKALLPQLARQSEAMIVTVSSGLSYVTSPIHPVYSATKAGVHMYTDALRIQLKKAGTNIHVMELVPPLVAETNLQSDAQSGGGIPNMSLVTLVKHGIQGMARNKKRVVPGMSKFLRVAGKYFPDALSNAMARG
ncbi:SDR family NAD(P)-dependent oxidoreductase [Paenibacillus sp. IB182496]|uniref:SDR family NAD(P)-dependent oxidoreductase n=1 Tax=Paenibacillus sabuli TaxID=2772509 RepID=A0A927BU66_9BACL|nr:SDR family NAD(P)-dependent oxidoreductase [Paenibacillus sabuli]MBD2846382.1 SDR family NAD(P)-dependent oxidoreductase [Paenibacillus sabuli]